MSALRAIFVVLVAMSVAIAPAAMAMPVTVSSVEMASVDQGNVPCCPCCDSQEKSKASVACTVKCISSYNAVLPQTVPLPRIAHANPLALSVNDLHGHIRSPPTHPPPA